MLREYALSPRVFDPKAYPSPEVFRSCMRQLDREFHRHGLVRNLRCGEWLAALLSSDFRENLMGKEVIKTLEKRKRLVPAESHLLQTPRNDREWTEEALLGHKKAKAFGIVTATESAAFFSEQKIVAAAADLEEAPWWIGRQDTATFARTVEDYITTFRPVLRHSRGLIFVDPYIDTRKEGYETSLREILGYLARKNPSCHVEFVAQYLERNDTGQSRAEHLSALIDGFKLNVVLKFVQGVFFRKYGHDRFLISDLASFSLTNGFDADVDSPRMMTVCLLEDAVCEDLQRQIDCANVGSSRQYRL